MTMVMIPQLNNDEKSRHTKRDRSGEELLEDNELRDDQHDEDGLESEGEDNQDDYSGSTTLNADQDQEHDYRDYSTSPARLDGAGILQDINEMSECADRINYILEYGASSANSGHSTPQRRSHLRSLSPINLIYNPVTEASEGEQIADNDDDYNSGEVD